MRRVNITLSDTPPTRSAPTSTGIAFLATVPFKGAFDPTRPIRSMDQLSQVHGARQSYSPCWDWCETKFREGASAIYLAPVRGPAAAVATLNIPGTAGTGLVATANSVGDWANGATGGYSIQVVNGPINGAGYRQLVVFYNAIEVGRSIEFNANASVVGAVINGEVTITLGGGTGLPPVAAAANLASGTLDRGSITQTQVDAALALFAADLGPGQVASPDWQTTAAHASLRAHAKANNRFALPDAPDGSIKSGLLTLGAAIQAATDGDYSSPVLQPWLTIQGINGGAARSVPASAFVAAKCTQTDDNPSGGPNQAPAGEFGRQTSSLVTGVKATWSDQDQKDLEAGGVATIVSQFGTVMFDTNRTGVNPASVLATDWLQMSTARYRMSLVARLQASGAGFAHVKITWTKISEFDTVLTGILQRDEQADWLFRDPDGRAGSSYSVVTSDPVNTATTIAADQLNANVGFRPAPGADMVNINLTKVAVTDQVAA